MKKLLKGFIVISIILISFFMVAGRCYAQIPEPGNIFFGTVRLDGELLTADSLAHITLKIDPYEELIASYTMGDNPAANDFYVLRVPIYAPAFEDPDEAQPGDGALIYVNDMLAGTGIIGPMGSIQLADLDTGFGAEDSDGDGLPNALELTLGTNPLIIDTDGNGTPDGNEDADSDGFTNFEEVKAGTDSSSSGSKPLTFLDPNNNEIPDLTPGLHFISLEFEPPGSVYTAFDILEHFTKKGKNINIHTHPLFSVIPGGKNIATYWFMDRLSGKNFAIVEGTLYLMYIQ